MKRCNALWGRTLAGRTGVAVLMLALAACGPEEVPEREGAGRREAGRGAGGGPPGGEPSGGGSPGGGSGRPGGAGGFPGFGDGQSDRGVPVEVASVARRPIASFLETHGTLDAENDVDIVARTAGPIVELAAEEGMAVKQGQILARIDDREMRAQLEVSKVQLRETELAYQRAKKLQAGELVSQETLDQALANYQSAQGDFERLRVQLLYTEIVAPFDGLIVERYVRFAEHLAQGARLFRLSDFDPLLCPIQVPERELPRLRVGQTARLEVEAWGDTAFEARVLRISPVVNAATGTVKVTLEVRGQGKLRPGMFASVFLEMERRPDALVIPKAALALDSLGDTVFVAEGEVAVRRSLTLGFQNDNLLEVREGLAAGESVIVVGQDGLSEGTPIEILRTVDIAGERVAEAGEASAPGPTAGAGNRRDGEGRGGRPGGGFRDVDLDDPQQVERIRGFMRQRGLSDAEIEDRLKRMRQRRGGGPAPQGGGSQPR